MINTDMLDHSPVGLITISSVENTTSDSNDDNFGQVARRSKR